MLFSVVIPTYKREKDLNECLVSILKQSFLPLEVFVIDNARDTETEKLVFAQEKFFNDNGLKLGYIKNKENSLTSARNLGAKLCKGDIVSFLDDDVVLDKDYFLETKKFFENNPRALGMSGKPIENLYEKNRLKFAFAQFLGKIFFLGFNEKSKGRVLPSLGVTIPMDSNIISCEWLGGASSCYKKIIFDEFSFDENLKKYSWSEDVDFSYRVYKKYPGTLFFNPKVKYLHKLSKEGRTIGKERAFMEEVYNLYLFYKLIPQNFKNKIIYIWARIGTIIYKLIKLRFLDIYFSILGTIFCLKNLKNIKKGDLEFFNKTLK
jgi:GT2 family glycosyltransferase